MTNPQASTTLLHPADVFTHLIITYLTPMFLATTGGDIQYARMAATEAVNAYAARDPIDLLSIAQIIAFGLAILNSLSRSMAENLPIALVLRLRGNAVSLGRAAERCRRALPDPPSSDRRGRSPLPQIRPRSRTPARGSRLRQHRPRRATPRRGNRQRPRPAQPAAPTTPKPHPAPKAEPPIQDMLQACIAHRRVAQPAPTFSAAGTPS